MYKFTLFTVTHLNHHKCCKVTHLVMIVVQMQLYLELLVKQYLGQK